MTAWTHNSMGQLHVLTLHLEVCHPQMHEGPFRCDQLVYGNSKGNPTTCARLSSFECDIQLGSTACYSLLVQTRLARIRATKASWLFCLIVYLLYLTASIQHKALERSDHDQFRSNQSVLKPAKKSICFCESCS